MGTCLEIAGKWSRDIKRGASCPIMTGFDAFIDESLRVVEERRHPHEYQAIGNMSEYAEWVGRCAGKSGLREVVTEHLAAGGCSVNMGDGLASMGFPLVAHLGMGASVSPVFDDFRSKCSKWVNIGIEPGKTTVQEFDDGKLMLCSMSHLSAFNAEFMAELLAQGEWIADGKKAQAIALTTWSVYPYATEAWELMLEGVKEHWTHRPHLFFDLADPASRSREDLKAVLQLISKFETLGKVTLSMNGNEALQVAEVLGLSPMETEPLDCEALAVALRDHLKVSEVGIHLVKCAAAATKEASALVQGPYCAKPVKSVGAGDRFNAGYLAGLVLGWSIEERLQLASASSGFFVREGRSASEQELAEFFKTWGRELEQVRAS